MSHTVNELELVTLEIIAVELDKSSRPNGLGVDGLNRFGVGTLNGLRVDAPNGVGVNAPETIVVEFVGESGEMSWSVI